MFQEMLGVYTNPLAVIGLVVIVHFVINALWGVLQTCRNLLAPIFLPNEETSLTKKYGPWACKYIFILILFCIQSC